MEDNLPQVAAYVTRLAASVGGCKPAVNEDALRRHYHQCEFADMLGMVKNAFSLPMQLRFGLVKNGGPESPAWVTVPKCMPCFGSSGLSEMRLTVYAKEHFLAEAGFNAVCQTFAHELAHLVIEALQHPLKDEERAVDVLAMVLGFADAYARHAQENLETDLNLGYLTPAERLFAYEMICHLR